MLERKVIIGNRVKNYKLVDPETGEILDQTVKVLAYIPKNTEKETFDKVFKTLWIKVLEDSNLKGVPLRILVWLMNKNSWNNDWIYVDYKDLAEELKHRVETIQRAFKTLKDANLVIQMSPRKTLFRLNPKYIYMGLAVKRQEDIT